MSYHISFYREIQNYPLIEPRKPVFRVFDQVLHKLGCTSTGNGLSLVLKFWIETVEELYYVAKTKALISIAVAEQLICAFVFCICKK